MSYNNFKYNMQKYAHIDPVTRNIVGCNALGAAKMGNV